MAHVGWTKQRSRPARPLFPSQPTATLRPNGRWDPSARLANATKDISMKRALVVALVVLAGLPGLAATSADASTTSSHAVLTLLVNVAPSELPASGGTVTVAGRVRNAQSCQLRLLSRQGFPVVYSHNPTTACRSGAYTAHVTLGANPSPVARTVAFALVARSGTLLAIRRFYVTLAAAPKPQILSARAFPAYLWAKGGQVTVAGRVRNAQSCQLRLLSRQGFPVVYSHNPTTACRSGAYTAHVTLGANPSPVARTVAFALVARSGTLLAIRRFYVTLAAHVTPPTTTTTTVLPLIISTEALPGGSVGTPYYFPLQAVGGTKPYTWRAQGLSPGLSLAASGVITGAPARAGDFEVTLTVSDPRGDANTAVMPMVVNPGVPPTTTTTVPPTTTTTTVPSAEATTISVSLSISPSAPNPSSSLTGDYTATADATCGYSDGSSGPCDLPAGTITWEALGGDAGGNFMYPSTTFPGCTSPVAATSGTSECTVKWATYGDQWLEATYTSSPSSQLEGQLVVPQVLPVQIAAPVDLAAGNSYDTYGNTGPQAVGDCMMAAAADWIETTFGTAPSSQEVVSDYWAAENELNGGADVGLTPSQLFTYWQSNAIGGYLLTGTDPISPSDVEAELSSDYVLFATVNLPSGYPLGDGQGGGHGWILVGYSSFGPMVVSWGEEFQISWADFDAWTTGVWALGANPQP